MAKATETDRIEKLESQLASQGELLRGLLSKMADVQAETVSAMKTLGASVKVRKPAEVARQHLDDLNQRLAILSRELYDGKQHFLCSVPGERRMDRVCGGWDSDSALGKFRRHFGVISTIPEKSPVARLLPESEAEQLYVETCRRYGVIPLDSDGRPWPGENPTTPTATPIEPKYYGARPENAGN